jgi:hypothetical protein
MSFTLRIDLSFVSLTIRIDNTSCGMSLIDEFDAHDLLSELFLEFLGLASAFGQVNSNSLDIEWVIVLGCVVFNF